MQKINKFVSGEISAYHNSFSKKCFDLTIALGGIIFLAPVFLIFGILLKLINDGPVFFIQRRVGKDGKVFNFIKFRTMRVGAERERAKYMHLNEADGPVFKIRNDPRYTKFGKILARTGLDELPQLINVLRGEMSLVGPRPLPIYEAKNVPKRYQKRFSILPGITSRWIVKGAHDLTFDEWMRLDLDYVENGSLLIDIEVLSKTAMLVLKSIPRQLPKTFYEKS